MVSVEMNENIFIKAIFEPVAYSINVTCEGEGTIELHPEKAEYVYGEQIQITAHGDPGWSFSHWEGDVSGSQKTLEIRVYDHMNITAVFTQDEYAISKDIIGQGAITLRPEKGKYYYGDAVEIEASAVDGWRFSHWEGDIDPDKTSWNPVTIVVRDNIDLLAVFKREEFIVSIGEKGSGSVSIQPQKDAYHYGDQITITATPAQAWAFSHWEGDIQTTFNPLSLTVTGNLSLTAVFTQNEYFLNVEVEGSGTVLRNPSRGTYPLGTTVNLSAVANPGWVFSHWEGDITGSSADNTITMDENKNVTAVFAAIPYSINIDYESDRGSIEINPAKDYYIYGEEVTITAIPNTGYRFSVFAREIDDYEWEYLYDNPLTMIVTDNIELFASFVSVFYLLDLSTIGNGSVDIEPNMGAYPHGEEVSLIAIPGDGWVFERWEGDVTVDLSDNTKATLIMDGHKTVRAVFAEINHTTRTLTINPPRGLGEVQPKPGVHTYDSWEQVEILAAPAEGWFFSGWEVNSNVIGANPANIVLSEDMTITPVFKQINVSWDPMGYNLGAAWTYKLFQEAEGWRYEDVFQEKVISTEQRNQTKIFKILQDQSETSAYGNFVLKENGQYYYLGYWSYHDGDYYESLEDEPVPIERYPISLGDSLAVRVLIDLQLEVVGQEEITTPAGTFTAWLLQGKVSDDYWQLTDVTCWLIPYIGVVKCRVYQEDIAEATIELMSYDPGEVD